MLCDDIKISLHILSMDNIVRFINNYKIDFKRSPFIWFEI